MSAIYVQNVQQEWLNMSQFKPIDVENIRPCVYESWKRSLEYCVDPFTICEEHLLGEEDLARLSDLDQLSEYRDIITAIQDIAVEMELSIEVFDRSAQIKAVLAFPGRFHSEDCLGKRNKCTIFRDLSEEKVGTNSIVLALREDRPIQLLGPEHFKQPLHNANCSAAPIHDIDGNVNGAINLVSHNTLQTTETLGLATSIARILDNHVTIKNMVEKLTVSNSALNEVIEYLPQGIIWCNGRDEVKNYNRKIFPLLRIEEMKERKSLNFSQLDSYVQQIKLAYKEMDVDQKEIVLDLQGKKKTLLVSVKSIRDQDKKVNGKLIVLEDVDKILRSTFKGNTPINTFEDIIGETKEIVELKRLANQIAKSPSAVLVHGESGTGKELIAQGIHNASLRRDHPFVAINCGAISSELIESELFGYEPGAFTGALKGGKIGKLEAASGGTLFLDEVESMSLNVQIKLLRVLSTSRVTKIGAISEIPIDIRIISATKKDLLKEAEFGNFREDLYFRISVLTLNIPPLNKRKEDIPLIVADLVKVYSKAFGISGVSVDDEFMKALMVYGWRGNIRELRNAVERAILLLGDDKILNVSTLPDQIVRAYENNKTTERAELFIDNLQTFEGKKGILHEVEQYVIDLILREENGNMKKTAERLGVSRPTLYKKIKTNASL
jgi:sigma-54 dependent transcriptional regulator, acetoin dehydrogenase operon transcriptional activator AcoR